MQTRMFSTQFSGSNTLKTSTPVCAARATKVSTTLSG